MSWLKRSRTFLLFRLSESEYSFRGVAYLILLYLGALVVAAVLAPPVYWGIQYWHETAPNALTRDIEDNPFSDTYDRLRWLPTLIALPFLLKACGLLSWSALGVSFRGRGLKLFLKTFLLGVVILAGVASLQGIYYGVTFVSTHNAGSWAGLLLGAILGGLLIGLLEEVVFRGMSFRMFYTWLRPVPALLLTSLFFSYAHFKMPDAVWEQTPGGVDWGSGFFVGFWTLFGIIPGWDPLVFLNVTLFGLVLGVLVMRQKSLMGAAGFHAGIVVAILVYTDATTINSQLRAEGLLHWFWGSGGLRDGLLTTFAFLITLLVLCLWHGNEEGSSR